MNATITELLPLAVVIAISPVPILAVIMMLLTDRERANPLAFLAGWICILTCLLYTSPSPRDRTRSRMPSSA